MKDYSEEGVLMTLIGTSNFRAQADRILRELRRRKKEFVLTDHGRPFAIIIPVNQEELEDYVLATHPFFVQMRVRAREEIEAGETVGIEALQSMG